VESAGLESKTSLEVGRTQGGNCEENKNDGLPWKLRFLWSLFSPAEVGFPRLGGLRYFADSREL